MTDSLCLSARSLPDAYTSAQQEREALDTGRGLVPLHDFALLTLVGRDVISYLQTKLTADTRKWGAGGVHYTTVTNINGQMLCDAWGWVDGGLTYLLAPAAHAERLVSHLDRYVIMEDVTITSAPFQGWAVGHAVVLPEGTPIVEGACSFAPHTTRLLWEPSNDPTALAHVVETLEQGAVGVRVGTRALATAQVDAGVPAFGVDLVPEKTIPLEAGLWHGVSFNKGCYLGQEVIERLYSRGRPNKRLMMLTWQGDAVEAGTELTTDDGKAMGSVTRSHCDGGVARALGYVKRKALDDRTITLGIDGHAVTLGDYAGGEAPLKS